MLTLQNLRDALRSDVLSWHTNQQAVLEGLSQLAERCERVMSVCTGAALLAGESESVGQFRHMACVVCATSWSNAAFSFSAAGLLAGRRATTNKTAWAWATAQAKPGCEPKEWVRRSRWVHDGKFSTAAGESLATDEGLRAIPNAELVLLRRDCWDGHGIGHHQADVWPREGGVGGSQGGVRSARGCELGSVRSHGIGMTN